MRGLLLSGVLVLLAAPALHAQSMNIDYGVGASTPTPVYAGAGIAGVWNALDGTTTDPVPLVNVRGQISAATIALSLAQPAFMDDPATPPAHSRLMDDGILGGGDVLITVSFEGLRNDAYEVIAYGWTPTMPDDRTVLLIDGALQVTGGPWPSGFQPGFTHDVRIVNVSDGTLEIAFGGAQAGDTGFLNGLQLRRLTPADFNGDGVVDALDLLPVLANWGPCAPDCPGNVNGDDAVDALDLLAVLADWD